MNSFGSVLIAHWFLAPATLMWCRLLRDNPAERVARAWSRAMLHPMLITPVPDRVSQTEVVEQVSPQRVVPAPAAAGEHPAVIIELARHRSEAHASVGEEVGYDRCQILRMPVGTARDRRP